MDLLFQLNLGPADTLEAVGDSDFWLSTGVLELSVCELPWALRMVSPRSVSFFLKFQ